MRVIEDCTGNSYRLLYDIATDRSRFVGVFMLLHAMVFAFGFMNYDLKVGRHYSMIPSELTASQDNLTQARSTFTITYPIARSAALVLHVDIALILFRTQPTLTFIIGYRSRLTNIASCLP